MDEFSFREMKTWGQSKISSYCVFCLWCKSRELGGRGSSRFPSVTPIVETSSGRNTFRILSNINDGAPLRKQTTDLTRWLFSQESSTADLPLDSKCEFDQSYCKFGGWVELVAAGWCTTKWLRFDQTIRNFTSGDLGIQLVVILLGVTGLRKTRVMYLLDLFEGRGGKWQSDLLFGVLLDDWANANAGLCWCLYSRVVSGVLILWGVDPILRNGCRI